MIPYTERDLATRRAGRASLLGGGVRPDDTVLHCLAYGFYTGGVSDHLALEATGATMVPVGLGQSAGLELWRELRPTALFSTITYPLHLAEVAEERNDPRDLGLSKLIVTGEPGGQIATRRRLEDLWGARRRHLRALRRLGNLRGRVRGA